MIPWSLSIDVNSFPANLFLKPTFAPGLRVSRRVKLWDNPDAPQPGKLDDHLHIARRVHVGVRVVSALLAKKKNNK